MQHVRYENSKGETLSFGTQRPLLLQRILGTGNVNVDVQTQKSPFQDGRTFLKAKLEPREIFVQLAIVTTDRAELFEWRERVSALFNPKLGEGVLTYTTPRGNYDIKAIAEETPKFTEYNGDRVTCQINLICNDPFWYEREDRSYEFQAPYVPTFEFPFYSDPTHQLEFGYEQEEVAVFNAGTVYTPLIIEFHGGIKNAVLTNKTTGDYIVIQKELLEGEILTVDTSFGSRKIRLKEIDGSETNAVKYMAIDSKWLQLETGVNDISYLAESDTNVVVKLKWTPRYSGL